MIIYVDTNVIMDFLMERGSSAGTLFKKVISCKHFVIISDLVLCELKFQKIDVKGFVTLLQALHKLEIVSTSNTDKSSARSITQTHYNDALHYLLAKKHLAECIVTSNIKDFSWFDDMLVRKPDNL